MYRQRFGLTHHPLPKDAKGLTCFDQSAGYLQLRRSFNRLRRDPGLGLLTADAGVGKTTGVRNLCGELPRPDFQVLYLCDTQVSPLDLYRTLAQELGVRPSHRRAQLWDDIKKTLCHLADERSTSVVLIIDEAQHLSDRFLADLSGFLNFAFDSRDLLTLWLVGLPALDRTLRMQQHAPLWMRISEKVHLEPLERAPFLACIDHGLKAAGATQRLLADSALELLFRASRGILRLAARILRLALELAHDNDQSFIDDRLMDAAIELVLPKKVSP